MTKILSLRLDDHVAVLVAERASRRGVSINQEINDALIRDAAASDAEVDAWTDEMTTTYSTVMERLA